jgi:hypothetical protein
VPGAVSPDSERTTGAARRWTSVARSSPPVAHTQSGPHVAVMSKTRQEVLEESRRKGMVAGAATVATVALGVTVSLPIAVMAAVPSAWLGWRWWKHRAENGIKF